MSNAIKSVSRVVKTMFSPETPKTPKTPKVKPVTAMPDPVEQEKAKRRSLQKQMGRRGRSSTVLSDSGTKLGG